jgi:hypothetical protein
MFQVPGQDRRLRNKDEVLGLLPPGEPGEPLAIAADFLTAHPVHHDRLGDRELVVLTDPTGANRVFAAARVRFAHYDGDRNVRDTDGGQWRLHEDALRGPDGRSLPRLPAQRAFWFGWHAAFPHTRLVR